jgi:hypothetical protein
MQQSDALKDSFLMSSGYSRSKLRVPSGEKYSMLKAGDDNLKRRRSTNSSARECSEDIPMKRIIDTQEIK